MGVFEDAFVDGIFDGLKPGSFRIADLMSSFESSGTVPGALRDAALQHQPRKLSCAGGTKHVDEGKANVVGGRGHSKTQMALHV